MANDVDMSGWSELLHSSSKLLEQAAPSAQFPPLQRNLDQLEALTKKLKAKTLRTEAPTQSIAATRLLAREGINAEQLARDLKSFELKTTFEDVFPAEATTVEEYLQQIHEMAMVSAVQEAQKDNLKNFNDYMMKVLENDWKKEKRDFLQSLSRISTLPRTNISESSPLRGRQGQIASLTYSPQISSGPSSMEPLALANRPIVEKKAAAYGEVVKNLTSARERGLPFKPATAFKCALESLGLNASGVKSVGIQKIWHLLSSLMGEDLAVQHNVSKKMSLVIGARRHLEWGHEKYIMETIQAHPAQAALGGAVGNLQRIRAFLCLYVYTLTISSYSSSMAASRSYFSTANYRFLSTEPDVAMTPDSVFEFDESDVWNSSTVSRSPEFRKKSPSSRISRKQCETKSYRKCSGATATATATAASLPVNVPDWSKILKDEYREYGRRDSDDDVDDDDLDHRIPPHEFLAKQLERTRIASFSVHEGVGRTLKGRDLSRVRNAIWEKTGFQD